MKISFSTHQLIVGRNCPNINLFSDLIQKQSFDKISDGVFHDVIFKLVNNNFLWIYANYGSAAPRTKNVMDLDKKTYVNNPRKKSQVELKNQFFGLYDYNNHILFLNNSKKKAFLIEILQEEFKMGVCIKNLYKTIDEFIETIDQIDRIKLIAYRDLFSCHGDLFKGTKDFFGFGEPEDFIIEAGYNRKKNLDIIERLKKFQQIKEDGCIKSLVCIGRDDNGFETIFNTDTFSQKIEIDPTQNDEKLFDETEVMEKLIQEITKRF